MADATQKYRVKLSDGSEFFVTTDGAAPSEDDVLAFLKSNPTAPQKSAPAAEGSGLGTMASAFQAAKDVGIGAAKGAAHSAIDAGRMVAPVLRQIPGVSNYVATPEQFQQARDATPYSNTAQQIGGGLETLGELAIPVGKAATVAKEIIPTTAKAGAKFQQVMASAKNMPVSITAPGQVALRISELAERGGSMPKAVRNFLTRVTDPSKGDLVYEEARDFASNISRLSADEYGRLTPVIGREVANLRVALNKAVAEAAGKAGKGKEYAEAMTEYARAMKIRGVFESAIEGAKRGAPYVTAAGLGTYFTKKLADLISGD